MPFNLLKTYNQLLDIVGMDESARRKSLRGVFNRDFCGCQPVFNGKEVYPTPKNGEIPIETLFTHLTTTMVDKDSRERVFELSRSQRLHWVRFHLNQKKAENMMIFSVKEPDGARTYCYDKDEKYVIVLEPYRNKTAYYLLSAYHIEGKDAQRDKIAKKYKRRLDEVL